jgi:hypothetical protein
MPDGRIGLALRLEIQTDKLDVVPVQDFTSPISIASTTEHVLIAASDVHPLPPRTASYQGRVVDYEWAPSAFRRCNACGDQLGVFAYSTRAELRQLSTESASGRHYCDACIDH